MFRALDSISRKPLMIFLMILQLALGFLVLNSSVSSYLDIYSRVSKIEGLFDVETTSLIKPNPNGDGEEIFNLPIENITNTYDYIKELKNKGFINNYYFYYPTVPQLPPFEEYYSKLDQENPGMDKSKQATIILDKNMFDRTPIEVSKGRSFSEEDFNLKEGKDILPIIIGEDLEQYAPIGTEFEYDNEDPLFHSKNKYKVIGVYKNNSVPTLMARSGFTYGVSVSNSLVLIPMTVEGNIYGLNMIGRDYGAFVEFKDLATKQVYEKSIIEKAKENKIAYVGVSVKEDIESTIKPIKEMAAISLILGIVLTTFSMIGIIATLLGYMMRRKKEFGTRIAVGGTMKSISYQIFFECLWISILAVCLTVGIIYLLYSQTEMEKFLDVIKQFYLYIYYGVFIVILSFFMSLPLIVRINKNTAVDLLRGK